MLMKLTPVEIRLKIETPDSSPSFVSRIAMSALRRSRSKFPAKRKNIDIVSHIYNKGQFKQYVTHSKGVGVP